MAFGRKIMVSPKGYGPFSRLRCWATGPVDPATETRAPPCTRKNGPITGRMGIAEMVSFVHDRLIFNAAAAAKGARVTDVIRPAISRPRNCIYGRPSEAAITAAVAMIKMGT